MPSSIPLVSIGHPGLRSGGSEARVLYGLTALRGIASRRVLLTGRPVEFERLNREYGTDLTPDEIDVRLPGRLGSRVTDFGDAMRGAWVGRFVRRSAEDADVCISGYNFADFGKPAIQFIADFSFDNELRRELHPPPPGARSWAHRPGMLRRMYLGLARLIAGRSGYDGRDDWIIANSQFTADVLKARRGIVCRQVLYPPVVCDAPDVPWDERENGFVCLGRISSEKRIERVIEIVARVRAMGHDVHLHIIGPIGEDAYGRMITAKIAENADWCFAAGSKRGREKFELLAQHKWAIHGCEGEAFGIAIAEQVRSGCVPFVPQTGGPAEIVADPSLCYSDVHDAAAKIDTLLRDEARQAQVRAHLAERATLFTTERFMAEFRQAVLDFARERGVM